MSRLAKTEEFLDLLATLNVRGVPDIVSAIHAWLMEHLDYADNRILYGVKPAGLPNRNVRWESFAFRRYATFVYGAVVLDRRLYEFVPGSVYVYGLPGAHLASATLPDLSTLPDYLHVHYGYDGRAERVFRQFLEHGWQEMELESNSRSWHEVPALPDIPAINGGLIRRLYSRYSQAFHKCTDYRLGEVQWMGNRREWEHSLRRECANEAEVEWLKRYRDGMNSYDPTCEELLAVFHALDAPVDQIETTEKLRQVFNDEMGLALRRLLHKYKKG